MSILRTLRKKFILSTIASKRSIPAPYLEKYLELTVLKDILDKLSVNCLLDVGANIGQFAQDLRLFGYTGRIVSFEPLASAFGDLSRTMKADKNWQGFNFALGDFTGIQNINVASDSKLSSLLPNNDSDDSNVQEEIQVKRLDDIWESLHINPSDSNVFLKMDTQGFDHRVFKGAADNIDSVCGLMSEVSVLPLYENMIDYKESLSLYESAGFSLCNLGIVSTDDSARVVELNCIMRR